MAQTVDVALSLSHAEQRTGGVGAWLKHVWAIWSRKPLGVIGGVIVFCLIVVALVAPAIAPHGPKDLVGRPLQTPSRAFPLGTNSLGQDVLSRTIFGAQISIAVGIAATTLAVSVGTLLGLISGYAGGWTDIIVQRVLEVLASLPVLVLTLLIIAVAGTPGTASSNLLVIAWQLKGIEFAIAIAFTFGIMRVIRAAAIVERNMAYVEAARYVGASPVRILWRHILPNVLPLVIVAFSTLIGSAILIEASLSFLGFGVASGTPSWGIDLAGRNRQFFVRVPTLMIGPGVALSLAVMGYNFLGDALRDILDPRLRSGR